MALDMTQLQELGRNYTAAWCSENAASVAAFFAAGGSRVLCYRRHHGSVVLLFRIPGTAGKVSAAMTNPSINLLGHLIPSRG
jgi:hypothetical protein